MLKFEKAILSGIAFSCSFEIQRGALYLIIQILENCEFWYYNLFREEISIKDDESIN